MPLDTNYWSAQGIQLTQVTCETGFDVNDNMTDPNDFSCCTYASCPDTNSISWTNVAGEGFIGCPDTNGEPILGLGAVGKFDCCSYIGCGDQNASNYGIHFNWNAPLGGTTGNSPTEYNEWGCSPNGTTIESNSTCCCSYNLGCADPTTPPDTNCPQCNYGATFAGCTVDGDACVTAGYVWASLDSNILTTAK